MLYFDYQLINWFSFGVARLACCSFLFLGSPYLDIYRSASLRLGGMFGSPLEGHLSPAKTALADRLQWARSSIRKKLDMSSQESPKSTPTKSKDEEDEKKKMKPQEQAVLTNIEQPLINLSLNHVDEKDSKIDHHLTNGNAEEVTQNHQSSVQSSPVRSPERHAITHGDPLGALDVITEVARSAEVTTSPPPATSPTKSFVLPDMSVRLFTTSRSTSSSGSSTEDDSSDSSEDDTSEETDSEEESDHSHDNVPSSASRLSIR